MRLKTSIENTNFLNRVKDLSGEDVLLCFQCGECTSACPLAHEMDILPSTLMRLAQLGLMEVLDSQAIWKCSSCFNCSARCPRSIDVAKIIESLRQLNLRKKIDHIQIKDISKEEISILPQLALIANLRKFTA